MALNKALTIDLGSARPPFPNEPQAAASAAPTANNPSPAATRSSGLEPPKDRDEAEQRLREQLRAMQAELDGSKRELAENQAALESARVEAAGLKVKQPVTNARLETVGQFNARHVRAVNGAGGNARYNSLSLESRFELLGLAPPTPEETQQVGTYFGRTSNAAQAQGLATKNPLKYNRLRHLAHELKLL